MWSLFVYFLIFLVPGVFAVSLYSFISCNKLSNCKTINLALIYNLLILGINLAGLRLKLGIRSFDALDEHLHCLCFTSKYIILCLIVGTVLVVLTWLLSHLICWCKGRLQKDNKDCCKK